MLGEYFVIRGKISNLFEGIFYKNEVVLDIGCGDRPYYHKKIKAKIVCADIVKTKKGHIVCDASSLPIKKSRFDGVICVNSLYYYKNPFNAVSEFSYVLRKGGKLAVLTPFMYPIHDAPDDKYRFTEYGLRELLKEDFEVKEIRTIGGIFNLPAVFFHSLLKGIPLIAPKNLRLFAKIISIVVFYIPYILAQLLSLLDFLDVTRRWPTYYFVVAIKK
ncbi:class I SAM-dependent methyltransferase [Candidatus Woesearchaeota archaeon]|nr:class I SAM-dependent methyltransferase [Candidatus Woesearchaeota archaeon]